MDLGLEGKVALVTGSYRGTGSGIAKELAQEGATVLVHGFEAGQPDAVVEEIVSSGFDARGIVGDLMTDAGADALGEAALSVAGRIDVLVNNYGVAESGAWQTSSTDDWVDIYQKNVLSGVRMIQRLTPGMRERSYGRIIWLGTVGSVRPSARMPHYYASKATLPNICLSLAKDLAGTGITVNLVSPGVIATAEVKAQFMKLAERKGWGEDWNEIQRRAIEGRFENPLGRLAEIEEVAGLVAFLASDRAGYINAANMRIDGGASDCAI
jgi:3-oxoacyl-[acyl-carrier protein] reductase